MCNKACTYTVIFLSNFYISRARSQGVSIFVQHVLGDVISPPIIGKCGKKDINRK